MRKKRFFKDGKTVHPQSNYIPKKMRNKPDVETDSGIFVRSQYEKITVKFFLEKKLQFVYEPLIILDGKQYRPDFFLSKHNLFIEICGFIHMPNYRDRVKFKKELYEKNNLKALFIEFDGKGSLENLLETELEKLNIL
ncbi:MAG: hypothetical protein DWP97_06320 [Calditrichaeota bacterium]|nr:MAG: hypothetical protein DWP97_06320 [Calditrichota bacterium]